MKSPSARQSMIGQDFCDDNESSTRRVLISINIIKDRKMIIFYTVAYISGYSVNMPSTFNSSKKNI